MSTFRVKYIIEQEVTVLTARDHADAASHARQAMARKHRVEFIRVLEVTQIPDPPAQATPA